MRNRSRLRRKPFIADSLNNRIRMVSHGVITTVAGNGTAGFAGDYGPATEAELMLPTAVAIDSAGNLCIADTLNQRIRKVANGIISTVAGDGLTSPLGDSGPATSKASQLAFGRRGRLERQSLHLRRK